MTDGIATVTRSACIASSDAWTTSAFDFITRTTARRSETTHNGSNVALSTSDRATARTCLPAGSWWCDHLRRLPQEIARAPTPLQVGDHVGRLRRSVGIAVRGLQTEPQIRLVGRRHRRPVPPPSGPRQSEHLAGG